MTVKPPKDRLAWENLAGCVGRSRLRNGHESFHFVRNGLDAFMFLFSSLRDYAARRGWAD